MITLKNNLLLKVSTLLLDDYHLLLRYVEGKAIHKIIYFTETKICFELEDNTRLNISNLEGELIFDIQLPSYSSPAAPLCSKTFPKHNPIINQF